MDRFRRFFMHSTATAFATVFVAVELFVAGYYSIFEPGRLWLELLISGAITISAGLPATWFIMRQHRNLRSLTMQLHKMSLIDQMTGLLNRQAFIQQLDARLSSAPPGASAGAFAYIDADYFKQLNDRHGHAVGDKALVLIADLIRASTRPDDLCARLGGEEFGIFLEEASLEQAAAVCERVRLDVSSRANLLSVGGIRISVSIGIAAHKPGMGVEALMQEADHSLYAAKNAGRNAVVIELRRHLAA